MTQTHRVMSFNINGIQGEDANSWQVRAPLNLAVIRRYAPDIIGLQEASETNLETYREQLTDYRLVLGNCYGDTPPQEYSSILYKASRYELLETGEFWFSETPGSQSTGWGVDYPMGVTWVKLKCSVTNQQLVHLNTHFEDGPWGEESRVKASQLITARLTQLAGTVPQVITGDFNCNPWSKPYRIFLDSGFQDTYRAAGNADALDASTMHLFKGKEYFALEVGDQMVWRVDWILARGGEYAVQTVASGIVRDASPPTYPSDHYPVISEIVLL
jgi:endonuclease/exonuclease/phosphatase family metal-dependent hydrolase